MLQGKNLINGEWTGSEKTIASVDLVSTNFAQASLNQVKEACQVARAAFRPYSQKSRRERAIFLNRIADEIDFIGDQIRLEPIILNKKSKIQDLLTFYMGKNTPDRQEFIIDKLRVEKDLIET